MIILNHPSLSSHEQITRQRQIRALRRYLGHVVLPFSPFYRDQWRRQGFDPNKLRTWDDLRRIPFTSKEDLLPDNEHPTKPRDLILAPERSQLLRRPSTIASALIIGKRNTQQMLEREFRPILMTTTTGRSTEPVSFVYTARDVARLGDAGARVMEVCGAQRDFRMLNMFPYAPHLAFWITHYAAMTFGTFTLSTGGGKVMGTDGNLRAIARLEPDILIGVPTFVYHVMHHAIQDCVRMPKLKKIVLGGEKVPNGMRRKLRAMAAELGAERVDVITTYAFTEAKMAWSECPRAPEEEPCGYHLYPDLGIIEIVNPDTLEPVGEGEPGEIVFTPVGARGSVVIRYRTGDVTDGGVVWEPCPGCGRRVPRLIGDISRRSDVRPLQLAKLKGTLVDFNVLEHILDDCQDVGTWQIELRKHNNDPLDLDELILHVMKHGDEDDEILETHLHHLFASRLELHPNRIEFHSAAEMSRIQGLGVEIKEQRIVDHRPQTAEQKGVSHV
ncbi:MAG TPA: AMP-binding protein [Chthoniobacterales bacterium]